MVEYLSLVIATRFIVFYSIFSLSIFILYLGKENNPRKKLTFPWVAVFSGIIVSAFVHLINVAEIIEIVSMNVGFALEGIASISGGLLITGGIAWIVAEKMYEINLLRKREIEVREILLRLKELFLARKISEEDLKKIYPELIKELAEIEVRIKKIK